MQRNLSRHKVCHNVILYSLVIFITGKSCFLDICSFEGSFPNDPIDSFLSSYCMDLIGKCVDDATDEHQKNGKTFQCFFGCKNSVSSICHMEISEKSIRICMDTHAILHLYRDRNAADPEDVIKDNDSSSVVSQISCSQEGRVLIYLQVICVAQDDSIHTIFRVSIQVHDINDNGPLFQQTHWYKKVKEVIYGKNRRIDLPRAFDADLLEHNRVIHYRLDTGFLTDNLPFALETNSMGQPQLVLTEDLDAETKIRHLCDLIAFSPVALWTPGNETITANEITSKREARLRIEIEVEDMNDNEPKFESSVVEINIPEDCVPNSIIYQLIAHDSDITAQLAYSMDISTPREKMTTTTHIPSVAASTFEVQTNGKVRLRKRLDREQHDRFRIPVRVTDGEFVVRAMLLVHVQDVNDETPRMLVNPNPLVVDEGAPIGKMIGRVRITDPDSASVNGEIHCQEPESLRGLQALAFLPDPHLRPSSPTYDLTTRVLLDRERTLYGKQKDFLEVYLICSDGHDRDGNRNAARHTITGTIVLRIQDVNDHPPSFLKPVYHVTMSENNVIGARVVQVHATDADTGNNSRIIYSLLDRANFRVDPLTGWITTNRQFDREKRDSFQVSVIATDQGRPPLSTTVLLNLTILDINDHTPLMPKLDASNVSSFGVLPIRVDRMQNQQQAEEEVQRYESNVFTVWENSLPNLHIGDVIASDADSGLNGLLQFELLPHRRAYWTKRFRLLRNGSLYLAARLDREEQNRYKLRVRVSDSSTENPLTSTGTILIIVLDVNDNSPTFLQPDGLLPSTVNFSRPNDRLQQSSNMLYDQPSPSRSINVKPRGINDSGFPHISIPSNGKRAPTMPSVVEVRPTLRLSIHEQPGYPVTRVRATDPDGGANGEIRFQLVPEASVANRTDGSTVSDRVVADMLRIEPTLGLIVLLRRMTQSDLGLHYFNVTATDQGVLVQRKESKIMLISIEDIPPIGRLRVDIPPDPLQNRVNRIINGTSKWGLIILVTGISSILILLVAITLCIVKFRAKFRHSYSLSSSSITDGKPHLQTNQMREQREGANAEIVGQMERMETSFMSVVEVDHSKESLQTRHVTDSLVPVTCLPTMSHNNMFVSTGPTMDVNLSNAWQLGINTSVASFKPDRTVRTVCSLAELFYPSMDSGVYGHTNGLNQATMHPLSLVVVEDGLPLLNPSLETSHLEGMEKIEMKLTQSDYPQVVHIPCGNTS